MERHRIVLVGSVLRVVSMAASTLVGFFLLPFLIHRLGDRMYGYWSLVGAVLGYYGILDLGITSAVQFQVAKAIGEGDTESPNRALSTAVVAFAAIGLFAFLVTILVAIASPFFIKQAVDISRFRTVLIMMGVGLAVGFPGRAFLGAVCAHLRVDISSAIGISVLVLRTILIVGVICAGGGIIGLAALSLLSDMATYMANYLVLRKIQQGLRISFSLASKETLKGLFHYSRHASIIQVGDLLRFAIDGWMVAAFVGVGAVAHFAIASRLSSYFMMFMIGTVGMLSPWFSQLLGSQDFDGIRRMLVIGTKISVVISTIVAFSLLLYGHAFIAAWMGTNYLDAYWPSLILVAAVFCDVAQLPSVNYLLGVSLHGFLAYQTIAEGVANFLLSMYWGHRYGMIGVALGTLVPMMVAKLLVQPVYVCRRAKFPIAKYYINAFAGSLVVPAISCVLVWSVLRPHVDSMNLLTVCLVVVLQGFISAVTALFCLFGSEDRRYLLGKLAPALNREPKSGSSSASSKAVTLVTKSEELS